MTLSFCAVVVPQAKAADFGFNAALSLTGSCNVSELDPVPDPSTPPCPDGAHPPAAFSSPRAVTTDFYGNIYVASYGRETGTPNGRIDIFDSSGYFITEIANLTGPKSVAVDSQGVLYVFEHRSSSPAVSQIVKYEPAASSYHPENGEIVYDSPPTVVDGELNNFVMGLTINPVNDHLFSRQGTVIAEYKSAAEGNEPLPSISLAGPGVSTTNLSVGLAVDAAHGRIYASVQVSSAPHGPYVIHVLELASPHNFIGTIEGGELPHGKFDAEPAIAVDEETGRIFTYFENPTGNAPVFVFDEDGDYLFSVDREFEYPNTGTQIWVDKGPFSPNTGYLFVPSLPPEGATGHVYVFGPTSEEAPEVESVSFSNVASDEAELRGRINTGNLATTYRIEYTTEQGFEENGFSGALVAGEGQLPAGTVPVAVSAFATGLSAETSYRFRVVATNSEGKDEAAAVFATYPSSPLSSCPNDSLRTGLSGILPDCRAYELVTPGATNARIPTGVGFFGVYFPTRQASPAGDRVSFFIEGGVLPGEDGTGSLGGDPYLSSRGSEGWSTAVAGPDGAESPALLSGSSSPDQEHSFWATGSSQGSAAVAGAGTSYVRYPDGHSAFVGRGTLGTDPKARGVLISEGGGHIIFVSGTPLGVGAVQLEENAPPDGTTAIYDRTGEVTHVVSLLPGDAPQSEGENANYAGASLDGEGVAFTINGTLYLRHANDETYEIGSGRTFAGVAEGGERIFYMQNGNLKAFDVGSGAITFATGGEITPVNISPDGSTAYFVSPDVLTGGQGPTGETPVDGERNLYRSREGAIKFIGVVTDRDVEGEVTNEKIDGLGLWLDAVGGGTLGKVPARTSPDGSVLLFESRAALSGYENDGYAEIYRYDAGADTLDCLSCNPTGEPGKGNAKLESIAKGRGASPEPFSAYSFVANLRADGRRALFESPEALVPWDTDGLLDVYEWEEQGVGSCTRSSGCVYLISSGQSGSPEYLYGVSDSGDDVFFRSSDLLLPADEEETPSIYDARVEGGFPEPAVAGPCQGEGCRPGVSPQPQLSSPAQPDLGVNDNIRKGRKCPAGKRKVKHRGKVRCVKKHHRHRGHKRHAGQAGGGAR